MNITPGDLIGIAGALSRPGDRFPPSALVSYGQTVIVKPGATTESGRLISGAQVADALGGSYAVFPLAVEYGATAPTTMDADAAAMTDLEKELDALGSDEFSGANPVDLFGEAPTMSRRAIRLRKRYTRVLGRWRKNATLALASNRSWRRKRAGRQLKRLKRIWAKMGGKGIPMAGLVSPEKAAAQVKGTAHKKPVPVPSPRRLVIGPQPVPVLAPRRLVHGPQQRHRGASRRRQRRVQSLLLESQDVLNRQADALTSSLMASYRGDHPIVYGADQQDLEADIRAETVGYLFGVTEHDYWGATGDEIQVLSSDPDDESALDTDLAELEADQAADAQAISADAASEKGTPSGDVDDDDDLDLDDLDLDDDALDLDDELDGEGAQAVAAAAKGISAVAQVVTAAQQAIPVPVSARQRSMMAQRRARLNRLLGSLVAASEAARQGVAAGHISTVGKAGRDQMSLLKRISVVQRKLAETNSAIKAVSPHGSVNYARLRPRRPGLGWRPPMPVVIALRKKIRPHLARRQAVHSLARRHEFVSTGSPLEVFAAGLAIAAPPEPVREGYSALEGLYMLHQATEPEDYYRGSGNLEDDLIRQSAWGPQGYSPAALAAMSPVEVEDDLLSPYTIESGGGISSDLDDDLDALLGADDDLDEFGRPRRRRRRARRRRRGRRGSAMGDDVDEMDAEFQDDLSLLDDELDELLGDDEDDFGEADFDEFGRRRRRRRRGPRRGKAPKHIRAKVRHARAAGKSPQAKKPASDAKGQAKQAGARYKRARQNYISTQKKGGDLGVHSAALSAAWAQLSSRQKGKRANRTPDKVRRRYPAKGATEGKQEIRDQAAAELESQTTSQAPTFEPPGSNNYLAMFGANMATQAFPFGDAAPFPPPRREGAEVFA